MAGISIPNPSYLDSFSSEFINGSRRWHDSERTRYYTWDSLHGEIEVFNRRGFHLGSIDAVTGIVKKNPVKGRKLNVR